MAYFSQEMKKAMAPKVKAVLKKYGLKGSLSVRHGTAVVLTVKSGKIDFIANYLNVGKVNDAEYVRQKGYIDVNTYWFEEHFTDDAVNFLKEIKLVMFEGNWDKSDIQTDYFCCGWYVDIRIGKWDKPYVFEGE